MVSFLTDRRGRRRAPLRQRARNLLLRRLPREQSLDARLYLFVNRLPHGPTVDRSVSMISDLGQGAGWVAMGTWLALRDGDRGRRAGLASIAAMLTAAGFVQGPAKALLRRPRPFVTRTATVIGVRPRDPSFPSGHTAGSFAAAIALAAFYPRDRRLLLAAASAVGLSRVYLGQHFPSDVVVGAAVGAGIGYVGSRLFGPRPPGAVIPPPGDESAAETPAT
jgi:membrane-associated phospholipid phosphatase